MKNKGFIRILSVLCIVLVCLGGFSVTAFAQTPTEETETDDSGVVYDPTPLTPEGNMELALEIEGEAAEDKEFIVVQSRNGNYFYIIIDHAAEGENSVHFLNQVDEADLLAIIEDGETTETTPAVCSCADKCETGKINTACPVCSVNMDSCTGKEAEPEPADTEPQEDTNNMGGIIIFLVVALLGGGGALYYFKVMKPKQAAKGDTDLDDFDFDEYDEDEPEEKTESTDTEAEDEKE